MDVTLLLVREADGLDMSGEEEEGIMLYGDITHWARLSGRSEEGATMALAC